MPEPPDGQPIETIKSVVETVLVRRFRESLYAQIGPDSPVAVRDGTYPVLAGLRAGPLTATELSQQAGVDRSVASRQAADLIAAGLVTRERDPRDRRGGLLRLTGDGQDAADRLDAAVSRLVAAATQDWSEARLAAFADCFAAFTAALLQGSDPDETA